jgi:tRNA(fMet)-specific endonuclease VapC
MARYLLDTNILIAAIKGTTMVRNRLEKLQRSEIVLSPIVLGELVTGVEKSRRPEHNRSALDAVVRHIDLLPMDHQTSEHYGQIRAELEHKGTIIGANDLWIAAQARAHDLVLVSNNTREFQRVPNLKLEDWLSR